MANIVFLDEYSLNDADLNGIRALGNYTGYEFTAPEQVLERAANADILIVNKVKLTADIIGNLPKLRLICEAATGVDNIDVQAAAKLLIHRSHTRLRSLFPDCPFPASGSAGTLY